ncbi:LpqB family beta-propeller domain-containing protein [Paeniglutamicibacter sulfureus]|uniref:LpqB family beta-propeller domain-containing protein n=1 Tax=Paeniglutamicibacter sulfureus TaxID=43666 RepID=UPI0026661E6D|nr:LpqB family beta-propeller domain-containing protein [Paeniglutamicibacter sulfureus]MDO2932745.1 LpqB family beta-propeller domain-containing protein [Paeniglutamicibacter sulfureus]
MTRKRPSTASLLAVLLGVVLVLTGCSEIPRNSPVQSIALDGNNNEEGGDVQFTAPGPTEGDGPREIVEDFIQAGVASQDDYKVAREYLTPKQSGVWKGSVRSLVYDDRPSVIPGSNPNTYTIQLELVSEIDEAGIMTEMPPHTTRALDVSLEKVDGQWRISQLPDGIMLDTANFAHVFSPQTLYFYDVTFAYAVPDVRWFPNRTGVAAAMVEALLAGPSEYLENAVVSAFPGGSSLVRSSVPIESQRATVDLGSATFLESTELSRQLMQQQLELTLGGLGSVRSVVMSDEQSEIKIGAKDPEFEVAEVNPAVPDTQIGVVDDALYYLKGRSLRLVGGIGDIAGYQPRLPAMSPLGNRYAFLNGSLTSLIVVDEEGRSSVVATGEDLVRPSMDAHGWTWTVDNSSATSVLAVPADPTVNGKVRPITADGLTDANVSSLRVSRDGTRALIVSSKDGQTSVAIAGILRDADGAPRGFAPPKNIYPDVPATQAVWNSDVSVIVSSASTTERVTAEEISLTGTRVKYLPLLGMVGLSAGPGDRRPVYAETNDEIYSRVGSSWHEMEDMVRDLSYPG